MLDLKVPTHLTEIPWDNASLGGVAVITPAMKAGINANPNAGAEKPHASTVDLGEETLTDTTVTPAQDSGFCAKDLATLHKIGKLAIAIDELSAQEHLPSDSGVRCLINELQNLNEREGLSAEGTVLLGEHFDQLRGLLLHFASTYDPEARDRAMGSQAEIFSRDDDNFISALVDQRAIPKILGQDSPKSLLNKLSAMLPTIIREAQRANTEMGEEDY